MEGDEVSEGRRVWRQEQLVLCPETTWRTAAAKRQGQAIPAKRQSPHAIGHWLTANTDPGEWKKLGKTMQNLTLDVKLNMSISFCLFFFSCFETRCLGLKKANSLYCSWHIPPAFPSDCEKLQKLQLELSAVFCAQVFSLHHYTSMYNSSKWRIKNKPSITVRVKAQFVYH